MPSMSFNLHEPDLSGLDIDHGEAGAALERVLRHPAYLDPHHPEHSRAMFEARAGYERIFGDKVVEGGQPFPVMSFKANGSGE